MKASEAADAWRHAVEHDRGFRGARLVVAGKPPLGDGEWDLPNGFTLICGLNGSGKTTLLRLAQAAASGIESVKGRCRYSLLVDGDFALTMIRNGAEERLTLTDEGRQDAYLLDAFDLCRRIQVVMEETNFPDLLEGVEPHSYEGLEMDDARYVVGKPYEAIELFEIEEPGSADSILPIFTVSTGGATYDCRAMGLGELAALASLWAIARLEPGTLVLVEEPETFLSSRSTVALLDVIARQVDRRRLYVIATTHSTDATTRVPVSAIRLLTPLLNGLLELRELATKAELEQMLGAPSGQARVIVVEDETARAWVQELLARYQGVWGQTIEVIGVGGASAVLSACQHWPDSQAARLAGCLDGDQPEPEATRAPIVRLPGEDPDETLRTGALSNIELFADRLGRDSTVVHGAIYRQSGADAHDWAGLVGGELSLSADAVRRAAVHCWLNDPANGEAAGAFVARLVRALTSEGLVEAEPEAEEQAGVEA